MKISKKIEYISLNNIDLNDQIFIYTYPRNIDEKLKNSIQNFGILNPIVLQEKSSGNYRIVSGFKRTRIATELEFENVPAYLFSEFFAFDADVSKFLFSIEENSSFRNFNELEKAAIIFKLLNEFKADDNILTRVCGILNIAFSDHNIQKYLSIAKLSEHLKGEIFGARLAWDTAVNLMKFTDENRDGILQIIQKLRLNLNFAREIVENLKDLMKSGKNVDEILAEIFKEIELDINSKDKVFIVRELLAKIKYPNLYAKEKKFDETRKMIESDGKIALTHFPFFERDEYTVTVNFKDIECFSDLKEMVKNLDERLRKK